MFEGFPIPPILDSLIGNKGETMSRPNLGYSNYHWIRQDQRAAKKKQSELKSELKGELTIGNTHENTHEKLEASATRNTPPPRSLRSSESDAKTQDFCDIEGEIQDTGDGNGDGSGETAVSTVQNPSDSDDSKHASSDSNHETAASKHETVQESLIHAALVRDGEGKSDVLPSVQHPPRIDSWLPAPVPDSDK